MLLQYQFAKCTSKQLTKYCYWQQRGRLLSFQLATTTGIPTTNTSTWEKKQPIIQKQQQLQFTNRKLFSSSLSSSSSNDNNTTIFPWRSKSTVIKRLQPDTIEYYNDIVFDNNIQLTLCYVYLNMPLSGALLFFQNSSDKPSFRQSLADSVAYVFPYGIQKLLIDSGFSNSNNSTKTLLNVDDDTNTLEFTFTTTKSDNNNNESNTIEGEGKDNVNTGTTGSKDNDNNAIHPILQNYYKNAYERIINEYTNASTTTNSSDNEGSTVTNNNNNNIQIQLRIEPIQAELYNIYCIPFVTRAEIETNTKLVSTLHDIVQNKNSIQKIFDYTNSRVENQVEYCRRNNTEPCFLQTIEIQVLIKCKEYYNIMNIDTGISLLSTTDKDNYDNDDENDNDNDKDIVYHLVRLETTAKITPTGAISWKSTHSNWTITDIDDIIHNNYSEITKSNNKIWYNTVPKFRVT